MSPDERFALVKCFSPDRLRAFRRERALTQRALAEAAGCAKLTVLRAEAGQVDPALRTLAALAGALGVDVADLFDDAGGSQ